MIRNDEELGIVRQQVGRVQSALDALARDVRPQNEARYRLMAESYEDQIRELWDQIGAYTGTPCPARRPVAEPAAPVQR